VQSPFGWKAKCLNEGLRQPMQSVVESFFWDDAEQIAKRSAPQRFPRGLPLAVRLPDGQEL